jgi:glucose-1-phosphate cytidylyltransferase
MSAANSERTSNMKIVILCGGKGTRIRGIADDLPKPMLPIGAYPILWHIMRSYAAFGFKEFILCLGYKSEAIKSFFLDYQSRVDDFTIDFSRGREIEFHASNSGIDWKVTLAETGLESFTGSRVRAIRNYIGNDPEFMLTYGDGVADIQFDRLLAFHRHHGRVMTVSGVYPPGRFGEIETVDGAVVEFNEKPQTTAGRISGGFFVCKRELFDLLDPDRDDVILEAQPMRDLAKAGQMMMYSHDGFWQCMDTFRDYSLLNEMWSSGNAPWTKYWAAHER